MAEETSLALDEDRALPADPGIRGIAREIYRQVRDLPVVSMHGHVDAGVFARDEQFADPAQLLITPDHYVVRMLVSQGYSHADFGVPAAEGSGVRVEDDPRTIWRRFCENWKLFRATPSRYWLEQELHDLFGVRQRPSGTNADAIYDTIDAALHSESFRPRALLERFNVEILGTTDSAVSTLDDHAELSDVLGPDRVVPTFRPDSLLHVNRANWRAEIRRLSAVSGIEVGDYDSFLAALRQRREAFVQAGARATDHGHYSPDTTPLPQAEVERIFAAALAGQASDTEADAFAANMLYEMARMSADDGLVMQLHPGVWRDHHPGVYQTHGPDRGFDIPVPVEFARTLKPVLNDFGFHPNFRLIVFTIDETVYSRDLAPLAGAYPAMKLGAPWWFLDSPEQMRRFRESAMETAGFYNTSGFVDDTRAFPSIPARHDLARRIDAGFLGKLVAEGRLAMDEALESAADLTYHLPLNSYPKPHSSAGRDRR